MPWAIILANLPAIISAGASILDYVKRIRAAAQQAGEWTPEHETNFQTLLDEAKGSPEWQPDK